MTSERIEAELEALRKRAGLVWLKLDVSEYFGVNWSGGVGERSGRCPTFARLQAHLGIDPQSQRDAEEYMMRAGA